MSLAQDLGAAVLGRLDPETAHRLAIKALRAGGPSPAPKPDDPVLAVRVARPQRLDGQTVSGFRVQSPKHRRAQVLSQAHAASSTDTAKATGRGP